MELESLTLAELNELSKRAAKLAEQKSGVADAVRKATEIARGVGKTLAELAAAVDMIDDVPRERRKVAPVYRNPADRAQTWTGRGRQPVWLRDALSAGVALESLRIDVQDAVP